MISMEMKGKEKFIINAKDFDLDLTLKSGQIFRWKKTEEGWIGEMKRNLVIVNQKGDKLIVKVIYSNGLLSKKDIIRFFSLDEDINKIYSSISTHPILKDAVKEFYGLRLIKQEVWPCMIGFVTSAFSNIPRIEKTLDKIAEEHGEEIEIEIKNGKRKFYLFPTISQIKNSNVKRLRKCGLGFRDKYVHKIAKMIKEEDLQKLKKMNYLDAKKRLLLLPGIGDKVADCVLLFSLEKGEAFPIDVWIKRVMNRLYGKEMQKYFSTNKKEFNYKEIQEFARHKWKNHAGYAQQFLYMYARKHRIK